MAKKKPAKASKKAVETLIVQSKVKDIVRDAGYNYSSDVTEALTQKVHGLLVSAMKRTEANGRKTLRASDL